MLWEKALFKVRKLLPKLRRKDDRSVKEVRLGDLDKLKEELSKLPMMSNFGEMFMPILIDKQPTIDPKTLPIVQGLRTQLDAIKEAYNVAGHRPLLTQAIERFGQDAQERMMFEEMSELQKAMCKLSRGKGCIDDIAQEIADVEIMLEQMKIIYQCEESTALWKHEKLERLRSLLNEGRDE